MHFKEIIVMKHLFQLRCRHDPATTARHRAAVPVRWCRPGGCGTGVRSAQYGTRTERSVTVRYVRNPERRYGMGVPVAQLPYLPVLCDAGPSWYDTGYVRPVGMHVVVGIPLPVKHVPGYEGQNVPWLRLTEKLTRFPQP